MQTIHLSTNGKHSGTKLLIDDKPIKFHTLYINGDMENDYDVVIGISQSKLTTEKIKQEGCLQPAIGFQLQGEPEYYEEEE